MFTSGFEIFYDIEILGINIFSTTCNYRTYASSTKSWLLGSGAVTQIKLSDNFWVSPELLRMQDVYRSPIIFLASCSELSLIRLIKVYVVVKSIFSPIRSVFRGLRNSNST